MFVFVSLITIQLLRGGKRTSSIIGVETCSWQDWTLYGVFFLEILCVTIYCGLYLRRLYNKKVKHGYKFVKGDMKWNPC